MNVKANRAGPIQSTLNAGWSVFSLFALRIRTILPGFVPDGLGEYLC